ncbi:MAG: AP2 domain-containing protein [Pyrinomonadaceae bacterium]
MAKSGHKDISRIDQPLKRTHGWYVRVRFGGNTQSKFFSDEVCGGRGSALERAIRYRNQTENELGKPRTDQVVVVNNNRSNTGVIGVQRRVKKSSGKDGQVLTSDVFEVTWQAGREIKGKTSVSIKKYGEAEAFRRACAIRRKKEQQMYGSAVAGKWADTLSKLVAA